MQFIVIDFFSDFSCATSQIKAILEYLETIEDDIGVLTKKVLDLSSEK